MVLLTSVLAEGSGERRETLREWYDEVVEFELEECGVVQRGGRWLRRLERARELRWLGSLSTNERQAARQAPKTRLKIVSTCLV